MGRVAEVPEDVSPLQIGVRGRDEGVEFELVGRIRWRWSDGAWNEWLALFGDGTTAWLGEAMGRYMLLRPISVLASNRLAKALAKDERVGVGLRVAMGGIDYTVTDVKDVTCVGSEGELPFSAPLGLPMLSVDLMASDGGCATVQKERGDIAAYAGRYVSLADVAATGLRRFEDWPMPNYAA